MSRVPRGNPESFLSSLCQWFLCAVMVPSLSVCGGWRALNLIELNCFYQNNNSGIFLDVVRKLS